MKYYMITNDRTIFYFGSLEQCKQRFAEAVSYQKDTKSPKSTNSAQSAKHTRIEEIKDRYNK